MTISRSSKASTRAQVPEYAAWSWDFLSFWLLGLTFARQIDRVVLEPERNFGDREVGEFDRLREHDVAVAILTSELTGVAEEIDFERPGLKLFRGHGLVVVLLDGNKIEQPEGATGLGDMLGTVGEQKSCGWPSGDTKSRNR